MRKRAVALFMFVMVLYVSNLNGLILSAIAPTDSTQFMHLGVSPELFVGAMYIIGVMVILSDRFATQPIIQTPIAPDLFLLFACLWMLSSVLYHAFVNGYSLRPVISVVSIFAYYYVTKSVVRIYAPFIARKLAAVIWGIPIVTFMFIAYFFLMGRISYLELFTLMPSDIQIDDIKPQIVGGMRSSELASYAGMQVLYLGYAYKLAATAPGKMFFLALTAVSLLWLMYLFSLGAMLALSIVGLVFIFSGMKWRTGKNALLAAALTTVAIALMPGKWSDAVVEIGRDKIQEKIIDLSIEGPRGSKYSELLIAAGENPISGIGWTRFKDRIDPIGEGEVFPHQNILGIAAEEGVGAAAMYALFMIAICVIGIGTLWRNRDFLDHPQLRPVKYLLFLGTGGFIYLQVHGLFIDTWQIKEIYFWAGVTAGLAAWIKECKRRMRISELPVRADMARSPG